MGFHDKHSELDALDSDVLVISECATEAKLKAKGLSFSSGSYLWVGDDENKGLAVIVRPPYKITPLFDYNEALPCWVMPVRITTPSLRSVDLLAVWSFWFRDDRNETGNPVVVALKRFGQRLDCKNLMVGGDFNTNVSMDVGKKHRHYTGNHALINEVLADFGLESVYHSVRRHEHGSELDPTHYWGPIKKPFHIDYIYAPSSWLRLEATVLVGTFDSNRRPKLSDHVSLTVDFPNVQ